MISNVNYTAHIKAMIIQRCLGSKDVLKSSQYVRTKNDSEVKAAYVISSHYSQSIGIAQSKVAITKDEKL